MDTISDTEQAQADVASAFLSAMANPKRLLILQVLVKGEIAVGALAAKVGLSQSALSQHLSKLRAQNLVTTRRDAQTIYYSSQSEAVLSILQALDDIFGTAVEMTGNKKLRIA
ncbi:metalloregulator ArsR/SmtB family transcription factor [Rhizobium sp. TRM95111]|uniref:ArsR/SmtB family transcription factor n=1 Tax=Rhizobium alarense TaxID=2846851 RepID=UPI001F34407A|nr:metalloregulator ArsR/SmtB family transcription factor [Rhizobium alarense]MCF3642378.1 metalloregulator ArsR/SmtB family transcription factor [Rhizobium alarense]